MSQGLGLEPVVANIIYQGGDSICEFEVTDQYGRAFDLTGATEIFAIFPGLTPTTPIVKQLSLSTVIVTFAKGGIFTATIAKADAIQMAPGPIDVELRVVISGQTTPTQIFAAATVVASLYPSVS
jgi:hypothetical protein